MSLFENIRDGKEPSTIVYKDEYVTAFEDKFPEAPVHILIIPNKKIKSMNHVEECDELFLGKILLSASKIAKEKGIGDSGYRLITNSGKEKTEPPTRFFSSEARKKPKCLPAAGVEIFRIVLCT